MAIDQVEKWLGLSGEPSVTIFDRTVDTSSLKVMKACEDRIEALERQKIRLAEQAEQSVLPDGRGL